MLASSHRSLHEAGRDVVRARAVRFNLGDVAQRRFRDTLQGIAREECLMAGDHDVWKCQQARQGIVGNHFVGQVFKENVGFA